MSDEINKTEKLKAIQFLLEFNKNYLIDYFEENPSNIEINLESLDDEEAFILICKLTREEYDLREIFNFVAERQGVDRMWESIT